MKVCGVSGLVGEDIKVSVLGIQLTLNRSLKMNPFFAELMRIIKLPHKFQ